MAAAPNGLSIFPLALVTQPQQAEYFVDNLNQLAELIAVQCAPIASPSFTTPTLGVATATSINGLTLTTSTGTLTVANGKTLTANSTLTLAGVDSKTLTVNNSLTLAGTDATVMTFPTTSDTVVGLTVAQTLTNKTLTDPIMTNVTRCSAQADATTTTLANITGLTQTVAVGTYRFRYFLTTTCGGTGGIKTAFKYTTTVVSAITYTSIAMTASAIAVATGTTTTDQATHIASNTANIAVIVEGTMTVSTGGTIALQFAENSTNSTSSVLVGSYMEFTRIA